MDCNHLNAWKFILITFGSHDSRGRGTEAADGYYP